MKFKLSGRRRDYASDYFFYKAVYYNNPIIAQKGYDAETFANQAAAYATTYERDAEGAVQLIANTKTFTPYAERAVDNFIEAAKKFGKWKQIYSLNRYEAGTKDETGKKNLGGRFAGFDRTQIKWDEDKKGYVYLGKYIITFENSPFDMRIQTLTEYNQPDMISLDNLGDLDPLDDYKKKKKAANKKPKTTKKKKTTTRKRR